jgi:hypothetical protein
VTLAQLRRRAALLESLAASIAEEWDCETWGETLEPTIKLAELHENPLEEVSPADVHRLLCEMAGRVDQRLGDAERGL